MARSDFKVSVTRLGKTPGSRLEVDLAGEISEVFVSSAWVEKGTFSHLRGYLEAVHGGILFTGVAEAEMTTECRRCLGQSKSQLKVEICELFEENYQEDAGDTYPIKGEFVDLSEMVRDALILALPPAPLCRANCKGLCQVCGGNLNEVDCGHRDDGIDPRFRILDQLR